LDKLKDTRLAKLSLSGVADLEGGTEAPEEAERGVDRPEISFRLTLGNKRPELMGGGFRGSLDELEVQFKPLRSSMAIVKLIVMGSCLGGLD
jgi:hypothetical protein